MKSRDILEKFRKGGMNERTITEILVVHNEMINKMEKDMVQLALMMNKLSDLIGTQMNALTGISKFSQHIMNRLGIKDGVDVGSEAPTRTPDDFKQEG